MTGPNRACRDFGFEPARLFARRVSASRHDQLGDAGINYLNGNKIIFWKSKPEASNSKLKVGTVIDSKKDKLLIKAGGGAIKALDWEPKDLKISKGVVLG